MADDKTPKEDLSGLLGPRRFGPSHLQGVATEGGSLQSLLTRADKLDARRRQQLQNQLDVINGLQAQLRDAKSEIWGQQIVLFVLLQRLDGYVAIPKEEIEAAPGGSVIVENNPDGGLTVKTKEEVAADAE